MKQDKKQSFWFYMTLTTIGAFLILIWISFAYFHSPSYICSRYPERCVCEGYQLNWIIPFKHDSPKEEGWSKTLSLNKYNIWKEALIRAKAYNIQDRCSKFRLKTQSELDIDDCNNNPREDEKCKCKEYSNEWITTKYSNGDISKSRICFSSLPKTECEKGNPNWIETIQPQTAVILVSDLTHQINETEDNRLRIDCMESTKHRECDYQIICQKKLK